MYTVDRDTVEEFWNAQILESCREYASQTDYSDFLRQLAYFIQTEGRLWVTRSGREALQQLLMNTVSSDKKSVLLCSFNCPVVADAVLNAGFTIETFDLSEPNGYIDWEGLAKQLKPNCGAL